MSKEKFVHRIAVELEIPKAQVERVVDLWMREISGHLVEEGRLELRGFGSWGVSERKGYKTVHPGTGEELEVGSSRRIHFRAAKALKAKLGD